jgi:hypothetical protein
LLLSKIFRDPVSETGRTYSESEKERNKVFRSGMGLPVERQEGT